MGIKLKDYITNPHNVFTEEEAIMLYKVAGHIETKLDSNQSILMAKLDTISNSITQQQEIFKRDVEIITENKINTLKEKMKEEQKETKKNMWQIAAAVATIASLAIAALQYFTS